MERLRHIDLENEWAFWYLLKKKKEKKKGWSWGTVAACIQTASVWDYVPSWHSWSILHKMKPGLRAAPNTNVQVRDSRSCFWILLSLWPPCVTYHNQSYSYSCTFCYHLTQIAVCRRASFEFFIVFSPWSLGRAPWPVGS